MSERARGAHRRCELVAPCVDQYHREDGEGRNEEHDLPDRIPLAEKAHGVAITANSSADITLSEIAWTTFMVSDCSPAPDGRGGGVAN